VFVIGAGPAGLTAAYLLTKQGISTTVIEADPHHVGGISRTASYKNFLFDIGGHRFFSKSKEVVDLWNEILPDDFISRPRMSRIYYNGNYFSYPLKAFEALTNLGPIESAMCVLSFMYKQAFPNDKPVTFHDWVANQFGERLFSIFSRPTPRRCGACPATRSRPTGLPSASKVSTCGRPCRTRCAINSHRSRKARPLRPTARSSKR
jgi:protoporphyrinogen oxidase